MVKAIIGLGIGLILGFYFGVYPLIKALPEPQGGVQGCVLDGRIVHQDGSVSNNWDCVDPN